MRSAFVVCLIAISTVGIATLVVSRDHNTPDPQLAPEHWERRAFMYRYQDWLLGRRLDVQCQVIPEDDTRALLVGPSVNRIFMRQFLRIDGLTSDMKHLGFQKITFWSGKSTDPAQEFVEDYDLTQ